MYSLRHWSARFLLVGILFAFGTEVGDMASTMLNNKYCYWAGVTEQNTLTASADGHFLPGYAAVIKVTYWLTFTVPLSLAFWWGTRSKVIAALPFWYTGLELLPTVVSNCLILARYHHFLNP